MELLVVLALLVALGVLAHRYGYDSRERPRSREEELAAGGITWERQPVAPRPPAVELAAARRDRADELAEAA